MKGKNEIVEEITLKTLFRVGTTAISCSFVSLFIALSFSSLIFSTILSVYHPQGAGIALITCVILGVFTASFSSYRGSVPLPSLESCVIIHLTGLAMLADPRFVNDPKGLYSTLFFFIAAASFSKGLVFVLISVFNKANYSRYIPYPVVAAIMLSFAFYLLKGSIAVMTGVYPTVDNISNILSHVSPFALLLSLGFATFFAMTQIKSKEYWLLPTTFFLLLALFYLPTLTGIWTVEDLRKGNWILGTFPTKGLFQPYYILSWSHINFQAFLSQLPKLLALVAVSFIPMVQKISTLERMRDIETSLNQEMKATGAGNILSGLLGGLPGNPSLSLSVFTYEAGTPMRLVGIFTSLTCAIILSFFPHFLSYIPKPFLGGILFYFSIEIFTTWGKRFLLLISPIGKIVVTMIFFSFLLFDFESGILLSIVFGTLLFASHYSSIQVVRHALSGSYYRSQVKRAEDHRQLLREQGDNTFLLRLQSYLFFGTSDILLNRIKARIFAKDKPHLKYLILDFQRVTGCDPACTFSFEKMIQYAKKFKFKILLTSLPRDVRFLFDQIILKYNCREVAIHASLDDGLEFCENSILEKLNPGRINASSLEKEILKAVPNAENVEQLLNYFEVVSVEKGDYIIKQGGNSRDLFFINSGEAEVYLELEDGRNVRVRKVESGTVVGEISMYLKSPRSASVIAVQDSVLYKMTKETLKKMKEEDPKSAALFHEYIAWVLAERLFDTDNLLKSLVE